MTTMTRILAVAFAVLSVSYSAHATTVEGTIDTFKAVENPNGIDSEVVNCIGSKAIQSATFPYVIAYESDNGIEWRPARYVKINQKEDGTYAIEVSAFGGGLNGFDCESLAAVYFKLKILHD